MVQSLKDGGQRLVQQLNIGMVMLFRIRVVAVVFVCLYESMLYVP